MKRWTNSGKGAPTGRITKAKRSRSAVVRRLFLINFDKTPPKQVKTSVATDNVSAIAHPCKAHISSFLTD
jgi:hypothetical protein